MEKWLDWNPYLELESAFLRLGQTFWQLHALADIFLTNDWGWHGIEPMLVFKRIKRTSLLGLWNFRYTAVLTARRNSHRLNRMRTKSGSQWEYVALMSRSGWCVPADFVIKIAGWWLRVYCFIQDYRLNGEVSRINGSSKACRKSGLCHGVGTIVYETIL